MDTSEIMQLFSKIENQTSYKFNDRLTYKTVSDYDQEIPQAHTADQPKATGRRATEHL